MPEQSVKQFRPEGLEGDLHFGGFGPQVLAYIERLENALDVIAECCDTHGPELYPVYAPSEANGHKWGFEGAQGSTFLETIENFQRKEYDNG